MGFPLVWFNAQISLYRTAFIEAMAETATQLHAICQTLKIHFSKRCNAIRILPPAEGRTTELVEMAFTDGTSTTADVVLGVDGVRSVVRSYVLGRGEPALSLQGPAGAGHSGGPSQVGLAGMAFMNSIAYRAAVPHAVLVREGIKTDIRNRPHCWIGPEQVSVFKKNKVIGEPMEYVYTVLCSISLRSH